MGWRTRVRHLWVELVSAWGKLLWGVRTVGLLPTVAGIGRLLSLRLRKPPRAQVLLRTGAVLEFSVPSQLAPALVLFRDLIDPEFSLLTQLARPDWVVLDVGAAIGQFSVFAARLPTAAVHAFEPSPANLTTLARNLALNSVAERVVVHAVALGAEDGEASFSTAGNAYLSRLAEPGGHADAGATTVAVRVRRLSDVVAELGLRHVDVLKLNVAGHEAKVLAGAESFLRDGGADVLVLLIGDESFPWYQRCADFGYRFFFYHPREQRLMPVTTFDSATLRHPAWPARHLIGVHRSAIERGVLGRVGVPAEVDGGA